MQPENGQAGGGFDDSDPKYRCCCKCCHVRTGTWILTVIGLLSSLINLANAAAGSNASTSGMILTAVDVVISCCMLGAMLTKNHILLLPRLILMGVNMVFSVIGIVVLVALGAAGGRELLVQLMNTPQFNPRGTDVSGLSSDQMQAALYSAVAAAGIGVLVNIWFFTVVHGCYKYFKDMKVAVTGTA